jgi:signal transduction histidine kinase
LKSKIRIIDYLYPNISRYTTRRKTVISVLLGLACLVFIPLGISTTIGELEYNIPWTIVFPIIITLAYGKRYGLISGLSGAAFYGFVLWPKEGTANLLVSIFFLILLLLTGRVASKDKERTDKEVLIRFLGIIGYIIVGLSIMYLLYNPVLSLNSYINSETAITEYEPTILYNFWVKDIINFSFLVISAELLLTLGFVRKLLGLHVRHFMKDNSLVFFQTAAGALLIWLIFVTLSKTLVDNETKQQGAYILVAFLTILWSDFIVARVLIRSVNKHLAFQKQLAKQNTEYMALNNKLIDTNARLRVSKEKAEQSDKLKTAFLTNITHEIRTPLNGILGFSSLLEAEVSDKQHKRYAELIIQSSNRLLLTINDVLDIAKIEAGEMKLNTENLDVIRLCRELYDFYNEQNFSIDFKLQLPEASEIIIKGDKAKLYQVLNNLLGNAVKFTETGFVKLSCKRNDDLLTFCIEDSGIGISPEEKDLIFRRFSQSEHLKQSKNAGTGLGLAIAKEFTELMGGKIWFESEYKKGSKFFVQLPLNKYE